MLSWLSLFLVMTIYGTAQFGRVLPLWSFTRVCLDGEWLPSSSYILSLLVSTELSVETTSLHLPSPKPFLPWALPHALLGHWTCPTFHGWIRTSLLNGKVLIILCPQLWGFIQMWDNRKELLLLTINHISMISGKRQTGNWLWWGAQNDVFS